MLDLEDIFGPGGPLEAALPGFRFRRQQLRMAERIAAALEARETLAVEAGTGTGKTFAYLVPALLCGARVLISTGTRTLQDQLFSKDLPLVAAALGRPARVALLKGRSNYLCRYRMAQASDASAQLPLEDWEDAHVRVAEEVPTQTAKVLQRIRNWSRTTRTGDLAELGGLSDSHPVWSHVTSTRESCLGNRCPEISRCHVAVARREALEADIVIVNHHLLLADLALKEDGFGDILGTADAVILDEAHQIPDLATEFFGARISSRRIEGLIDDLKAALASSTAAASLRNGIEAVEDGMRRLRQSVLSRPPRMPWTERQSPLNSAIEELAQSLQWLQERLESLQSEDSLAVLTERVSNLAAGLERIAAVDELEGARAIETRPHGFALTLMPFDIAARFESMLRARACAWVFTSATLSLGEDFSHFTHRLGLPEIATLRIDSPFNFELQSLLYLPAGLPEPAAPGFIDAVMATARPLILASGGGAFILFTSHRALSQAAALVRSRSNLEVPLRLFVQGEAPRERLLQEFRADGNAVLLGTASFWEGVDVKGDALRLVIIEKLPFASPEDPLVRARIEHLQSTGHNPFREYQLPEAALALKQGVGRLIRSEDDYGAVVICDPRIYARSYGRLLMSALPPMTVTREESDVLRFLRSHSPRPAAGDTRRTAS